MGINHLKLYTRWLAYLCCFKKRKSSKLNSQATELVNNNNNKKAKITAMFSRKKNLTGGQSWISKKDFFQESADISNTVSTAKLDDGCWNPVRKGHQISTILYLPERWHYLILENSECLTSSLSPERMKHWIEHTVGAQ